MAIEFIGKDADGLQIRVTCDFNINSETPKMRVKKPDGTVVTWNGTQEGDGSAGIYKYTIQPGDISQSGVYVVNAQIELAEDSGTLYGRGAQFLVSELGVPEL